jgi:hypothetical protein
MSEYQYYEFQAKAMCSVRPQPNPTDGPPEDGHCVHVTESRI